MVKKLRQLIYYLKILVQLVIILKNNIVMKIINSFISKILMAAILVAVASCGQNGDKNAGVLSGNLAERSFVPPGEHDEFYAFVSGGFSGQLAVYGLPSGRLFKVIPVYSVDAEKAYGFNEESKPMLETSFGTIPWDDSHHPDLSQTNGEVDGRWCFINGSWRICFCKFANRC